MHNTSSDSLQPIVPTRLRGVGTRKRKALMKRLVGKSVFGLLLASVCSLVACMTEVDRSTAVENTPRVEAQSLSNASSGSDTLGSESLSPEMALLVNSCIQNCNGDDLCI